MLSNTVGEEAKLEAMQRAWQSGKRIASSSSLFEEPTELQLFSSRPQNACSNEVPKVLRPSSPPPPPTYTCSDIESDSEILESPKVQQLCEQYHVSKTPKCITLDAASLGDFPAQYTVCALKSHQMPVVGVYVDKRVIPGYKYRVRPLPAPYQSITFPCLFNDKALTLRSIGRGYSRRFTFEADENCLNNNENFFWSDNRPEGFAFEIELISDGDKFTLYDANREAQGTLEVLNIEGPQVEVNSANTKEGIEKRAKVNFIGKVEFYETGVAKPMPLSGIAISIKRKGASNTEVVKIINVTIRRHRYILTPGVQKNARRVTVRGQDIGDIPTKYTMTGLEPYEIPVVGTYIDPRIIPGFFYKVRPNDRKEHLFEGRALRLLGIGIGYAKRLTFTPDSLIAPDNYLWSDNHPDGLGLEPRAVHTDMKFTIKADGQTLGEATVFRADMPQMEQKMEKKITSSGKYAIIKYIHVDVMCHVKLAITGGGSADNEEHLMRVCGLAVLCKEPASNEAYIVRVENVGLDSQLNLIFARSHTELTFLPL